MFSNFRDADGSEWAVAGRALLYDCRAAASPGVWTCSEGNSVASGIQFGEPAPPAYQSQVYETLPNINGPVTVRINWQLYGDEPTSGMMNVSGLYFTYLFVPIPEPSTALMMGLGLAGFAARGTRRR